MTEKKSFNDNEVIQLEKQLAVQTELEVSLSAIKT